MASRASPPTPAWVDAMLVVVVWYQWLQLKKEARRRGMTLGELVDWHRLVDAARD